VYPETKLALLFSFSAFSLCGCYVGIKNLTLIDVEHLEAPGAMGRHENPLLIKSQISQKAGPHVELTILIESKTLLDLLFKMFPALQSYCTGIETCSTFEGEMVLEEYNFSQSLPPSFNDD